MTPREQAIQFHDQGLMNVNSDPHLSYKMLVSACEVDPSFAGAWYAMGNSNAEFNLLASAVACYRRTMELPTGSENGDRNEELTVKALINIGHRLYHSGKLVEAEDFTRRALSRDPKASYGLVNLSMLESLKGNNKECLRLARLAYDLDQAPVIALALAFALLFDGQYIEGLKYFESRFPYKQQLQQFAHYPYPRWLGQNDNSDGKPGTLYIVGEQGIGDSLSFMRFIPTSAARVGKVVFGVQREIVRICQAVLPRNVDVLAIPHAFPAADWWCPIVSLPVALGLSDEEFKNAPGLKFPPYQIPAPWLAKDKFNIGIAWAGSKMNDIDKWRSIPLDQFLELYKVPGIQLYSLQVGDNANDVHNIGAATLIRDLSPIIRDAADTAAIINHLDLVISIESFVGHLCGAMGKECWIPYAYNGGDYRCGRQGDKPLWYANTRLFRQGRDAKWEPVFDKMITALRARLTRGKKS